jgi:hypothetical protein
LCEYVSWALPEDVICFSIKVITDVKEALDKVELTNQTTENLDESRRVQTVLNTQYTDATKNITEHYAAMGYIISKHRAVMKKQKCIVNYAKGKVIRFQPYIIPYRVLLTAPT